MYCKIKNAPVMNVRIDTGGDVPSISPWIATSKFAMKSSPTLQIIAGPNVSGKSTFARCFLRGEDLMSHFLRVVRRCGGSGLGILVKPVDFQGLMKHFINKVVFGDCMTKHDKIFSRMCVSLRSVVFAIRCKLLYENNMRELA